MLISPKTMGTAVEGEGLSVDGSFEWHLGGQSVQVYERAVEWVEAGGSAVLGHSMPAVA